MLRVLVLVRPSLSALAAVVAVLADDCLDVFAWAKALPAKDLAVLLAPGSRSTDEAVLVTFGPDCSRLDITDSFPWRLRNPNRACHGGARLEEVQATLRSDCCSSATSSVKSSGTWIGSSGSRLSL